MRLLLVGLAVALGWGLRGEIGGEQGALIPGTFLGLALAIVSGKRDWQKYAVVIGAGGALGMSMGGIQSYGILIGYTKGIDMLNVTYGYLMLAIVGGLWGAFASGIIGMVLSERHKSIWFWLLFIMLGYIGAELTYVLLIKVFGLLMTPPRVEYWAWVLGAVLVLFVVNFIQKEHKTCRLILRGFLAGAVGFMFGQSLQVYGSFLGPRFDWWKVMEISFGFVMGIGIAYGVFREYPDDKPIMKVTPLLNLFAIFIVLAFVPLITLHNLLQRFEENGILIRRDTLWTDSYFQILLRGIVLSIIGIYAYWKWSQERDITADVHWHLCFLWIWSLWANGFITLILMFIPKTNPTSAVIHGFFLILMMLLSFWVIQRRFDTVSECYVNKPAPRYRWVLLSLVSIPLLALFFAFTSIATHPGQMPEGLRKRFEWNQSTSTLPRLVEERQHISLDLDTTRMPNSKVYR